VIKCSLITSLHRRLLFITPIKLVRISKHIKCILDEKDTNITFLSIQNNSYAMLETIFITSPSLRIFPVSLINSRFDISNLLSSKNNPSGHDEGVTRDYSLGCYPLEDHEIILPLIHRISTTYEFLVSGFLIWSRIVE